VTKRSRRSHPLRCSQARRQNQCLPGRQEGHRETRRQPERAAQGFARDQKARVDGSATSSSFFRPFVGRRWTFGDRVTASRRHVSRIASRSSTFRFSDRQTTNQAGPFRAIQWSMWPKGAAKLGRAFGGVFGGPEDLQAPGLGSKRSGCVGSRTGSGYEPESGRTLGGVETRTGGTRARQPDPGARQRRTFPVGGERGTSEREVLLPWRGGTAKGACGPPSKPS